MEIGRYVDVACDISWIGAEVENLGQVGREGVRRMRCCKQQTEGLEEHGDDGLLNCGIVDFALRSYTRLQQVTGRAAGTIGETR